MALVIRIIVNKKKSVTYCQQVLFIVKVFCVHKVFIALFVEYPLCFLLRHNLHLHMLKTCSIGKTVLSVSCARFKSHICKLGPPPPTLRPRNPCICPCLSRRRRSTQISRLCPFLTHGYSVGVFLTHGYSVGVFVSHRYHSISISAFFCVLIASSLLCAPGGNRLDQSRPV